MPIKFEEKITREMVQSNPDSYFVFGDNLTRSGLGGQAKEMRGEKNAIGVVTKRYPAMRDDCFFSDNHYGDNIRKIIQDLEVIRYYLRMGYTVVFPSAGIGTGLSQMEKRCPRTYRFLQEALHAIKAEDKKAQGDFKSP